ncbi:MAG: SIR2 family protein, partial [Candidatus Hermodarchaeota archaeon]
MSSIKKSSNFNIDELFENGEKLTFLVGAGSSTSSPSLLPSTNEMIKALVNKFCLGSEKEKILNIKDLRFENLIEIIHESVSDNYKFLDFYLESDKPNIAHYTIADLLNKGHYVITTNFDSLIEQALLNLEIPKKKIIPVITDKDYEKYDDPVKLFKSGKIPIYKIHGAPKNIITGEDTRDYFINLMKLIGMNKSKHNIIQLEPYKAQLLYSIAENRTLLIIGYSGKNDYDLLSTLKILKGLKNLIWINHISEDL